MKIMLPSGTLIPFGYHSPLKDLYKQGKFQGLKSFSGEELTKPSIDHILPKSKGGSNNIGNYVLTNQKENADRGSKNIDYYLEKNIAGAMEYIKWFETHCVAGFDCKGYANAIIKMINRVSEKFVIINEKVNL